MKFNIPKTGRYQKYHSKKEQKDLESKCEVLDSLKRSRLRYLEYPKKQNGLAPSEGIRWFFQVLLYRVVALAEGGILAWNEGNPLVSVLAARSLVETVALAFYMVEESDKLIAKGQLMEVNNLVRGASFSYAPLPYRNKLRKLPSITAMIDRLGRYILPTETKDLSVNNPDLSPADDGGRKVMQCLMAGIGLLVAGIDFAKSVEPGMRGLHDPSPRPKARSLLLCTRFLAARPDVGRVIPIQHGLTGRFAGVGVVGTQVLRLFLGHLGPLDHHRIQDGLQLGDVMTIGSGDDEGKRDAMLVYQQMALASFFFPDPSGWGRQPLAPGAPCPSRRRWPATARRCLPFHRIRPIRLARAQGRPRPSPSVENSRERNWDCRTFPWARPSTGFPFARHRRSLQTPVGNPTACARRRVCGGMTCLDRGPAAATAAPPASRTRRRLPRIGCAAFFPP